MSKQSVEEQLAAIQELRASVLTGAGPADVSEAVTMSLRALLQQKNNLLVARAADLVRDLEMRTLVPELAAAFERFLDAGSDMDAKPAHSGQNAKGKSSKESPGKEKSRKVEKSDPQCWAKNALSKALHHLGGDDAGLFLRGMRTHQFEPVWGGQSDVAGTLRANCAHALVDCHELTHQATLLYLLELVADKDKAVRLEAMRAITAAGGDGAIVALRLRALVSPAAEEPEVIGTCFAGLLALEGVSAVPFVAQFLPQQNECSIEAALALGETRTPEALEVLLVCLKLSSGDAAGHENLAMRENLAPRPGRMRVFLEPAFADALLTGIALTRQSKAIDTLLDLVSTESSYAEAAIVGFATAHFGPDVQQRLAEIISKLDNARIQRAYKQHFPPLR